MLRSLLLWGSENAFLSRRMPRYRFVQRAVRRFMPGEEMEDALREASRLAEGGKGTVITLLGENVTAEQEATEVVEHYLSALEALAAGDFDVEISVKLTQLGLDLDRELAEANLRSLVEASARQGRLVWVDMESSGYVDRTLQLFESVRSDHEHVGVCLQSYLRRAADDLERLLNKGAAVRLVKGAYAEPASVAFPRKRDVDKAYYRLACRLLDQAPLRARAAFGTHDMALVERIRDVGRERRIADRELEFQMLYGIGTADQDRLAREGHAVRVLISYGSAWFPWYMRRLAERPANLGFVVRKFFSA